MVKLTTETNNILPGLAKREFDTASAIKIFLA
jgi:hypothetical protein